MRKQQITEASGPIPAMQIMNAEERARAVRDKLLSRPICDWAISSVSGILAPTLEWRELSAVLWNRTHLEMIDSAITSQPRNSVMARLKYPPYTLEVWVRDDRVLSVSWSESDRITMLEMEPGDWEEAYFALPPRLDFPQAIIH